jgi:pimeloyl-ACP methyl ester carboxylesterase
VLFFSQSSFLYHPTPRTGSAPTTSFANGDVRLLVSVHIEPGTSAVLYFGGNGEDVSQAMPLLVGAFPKTSIYALHYRGYGGSTGAPSEAGLVADGKLLFDSIRQTRRNVTVIGRSLGSGVAIQLASARPVSRLVLVTPYSSIVDVAAQRFKYVPVQWLLRDKYESWRFAPLVSAPTSVIAAGQDSVIPMQNTLRLLPHFKAGIATLTVIPNTEHNSISESARYVSALRGTNAGANKSFKPKPLRGSA